MRVEPMQEQTTLRNDSTNSDDKIIEVVDLVKMYGKNLAVDQVSFTVKPGEIFGFLGPNGAGKTTTMKMIAGLLRPTSGHIRVGGYALTDYPVEVKRMIGYVPDRPFIYEKLTAEEFLVFISGLYDIKRPDALARGHQLLDTFGLMHVKDELIENYSHGMKQRLTMAAALIHHPKLIIVDEPMVGLDPRGSLLLRKIFRQLCVRDGVAIFLSTHTLSIAEEVCDRIGILNKGRLIALGSLDELRQLAATGDGKLEEIFFRLTEEE
jgi:ABC-2 type transport system ATP-binding protein